MRIFSQQILRLKIFIMARSFFFLIFIDKFINIDLK